MAGSAWTNQLVSLIILSAMQQGFSGFFVYSPVPGPGNLIASVAAAAGTDPYGNAYQPGFTSYVSSSAFTQLDAGILSFNGGGVTPATIAAQAGILDIDSGLLSFGDTDSELILSSRAANLGTSQIDLTADDVLINGALTVPAGNSASFGVGVGPFVTGESFHSVSLPSGYSGSMRVKLLPWDAVWLDVALTGWPTTAGASTGGSLPNSGYYPTSTRVFDMALNGTPSGVATNLPRVFVPSSGGVQLIVPSNTNGSPALGGCSVMYPTN